METWCLRQGSCFKCQTHRIFKLRAYRNITCLERGKDLNPELLDHRGVEFLEFHEGSRRAVE